ncbi:MAG TPA: class I SAM-dependent methyltransferase, partial [Rhodopila sp.]|nr:class I SAM-dependent methyltransferase [Rhodopila sp.]
ASPEASVAMYSLGDPSTLAAATDEIIGWLRSNDLITPATTVLDLGCGIGRIAAALAPHVRSVHGVDVSPAMVREASRRCAGVPNVHFALTTGTDLAACPDGTFNLVLAVDTFPYLVQAGVAERHIAESRRVLRPAGSLVILNLSYRIAPGHDHLDAATWVRLHGFTIERNAERPFGLWDASCWIFRRD